MIRFGFNPKLCSACSVCSIACMDQNDIDSANGQAPYRQVYQTENNGRLANISSACRHCKNAPCVAACRLHCLYKDERTGLTLYDNSKCVGCRACERACPFDAITFRPTGLQRPKMRMEKCDGCITRIKAGLKPVCVRACPTGAISVYITDDETL